MKFASISSFFLFSIKLYFKYSHKERFASSSSGNSLSPLSPFELDSRPEISSISPSEHQGNHESANSPGTSTQHYLMSNQFQFPPLPEIFFPISTNYAYAGSSVNSVDTLNTPSSSPKAASGLMTDQVNGNGTFFRMF